MITTPTVFVLGAGASMPYGFPSGRQLVEQICEATRPKSTVLSDIPDDSHYLLSRESIQKILIDKFDQTKIEEFGKALYLSHQYSIDAFLEHRPEFTDIGKYSISLFILRKEVEADLVSFENRNKGCYQYLFNKINTRLSEFDRNQISFVTFNYDRSLEHFLFISFINAHRLSDKECASLTNNIPIVHVHGMLGKLPWQDDKTGIPYGTLDKNSGLNRFIFNSELAYKAAQQITVISEDQSASYEFRNAFQLLAQAEQIYFLGFSYHSINMRRLALDELPKLSNYRGDKMDVSPMFGTGYGMESAEVNAVKNKWFVKIRDTTSDSLLFLRKYANLG